MVRKRPEDVGKGKGKFPIINRLFINIENASQHFKSTGYIESINHLFKEHKMEEPTDDIVITFSCPGHGKVAWVSLQ